MSGTVTAPSGGPAADVAVIVPSSGDGVGEAVTGPDGTYSVLVPPGDLMLHVVPPLATRWAQRNLFLGFHDAALTHDVALVAGHLVSGTVTDPDGEAPSWSCWVEITPVWPAPEPGEWLGAEAAPGTGRFEVVAPARAHQLMARPPLPLYGVPAAVDLSSADVGGVTLLTSTTPVNPVPLTPPDARRITVGPVDGMGEAVVRGTAGAVLPLAHVLLVNVNATQQAHAVSAADGSFSARVFAPPGSALLIKHGPASERWYGVDKGAGEGLNPFPGTMLNLPHTHSGASGGVPFAAVGAVEIMVDSPEDPPNSVRSAWSVEGTLGTSSDTTYSPGDTLRVQGTMRLWGPGIDGATDAGAVEVIGFPGLMMLFDADGDPVASENYFMSTLLTPGGLPIQRPELVVLGPLEPIFFEAFDLVADHAVEGRFDVLWELPDDLPAGVYRPVAWLDPHNVPGADGWVSAKVTHTTYHPDQLVMAPIVVDDGSLGGHGIERRLIWRLLMDDPVQGTRGAGAREDRGRFALASQIVTQGASYSVPPVDPRSGAALAYRLEPFLPMLCFSDRNTPGPPLIPFALPGGELRVSVEGPDGTVRDLGSAPFVQSFDRTPTTAGGHDLNPGTTQLDDVYSLTTAADAFTVTFDQPGRHVVNMTGEVEDLWGATYTGGGTYDVWVAEPLDLDPGVLPGTPLEVGAAFSPSLSITPPVPADVEVTFTLYPASDAAHATTTTLSGRANRFGVFASDGAPIVPGAAGEYRVDIVATYSATSGDVYHGALTWGGVVMTPEAEAHLVAHGRRGLDSLGYIPSSWFVSSRDLVIPEGAISHSFNAYFAGDILWSRMSDGPWGGDALLVQASVQDTVGTIRSAIEARLRRRHPEGIPDDIAERIAAGEIPLFTTTTSDWPPRAAPADVDQIAYSYRSAQRPGVRVREVISEDGQSGGYWRLDTLYDRQAGVGMLGDLPHDLKLQLVGTVFRDLTTGHSEYGGQATGWVFIPDDDPTGTRVMPPFAGPGNGGWTSEGGPILTLKGEDVHLLLLPTGTRPGAVLEIGDTLSFSAHLMPPLASRVEVRVTSPGGSEYTIDGRASRVGYFHDPDDDLVVDEPGVWTVAVTATHDGRCSGGATVAPYPWGSVLGCEDGTYHVYVVPASSSPLRVDTPNPGWFEVTENIAPVVLEARVPAGLQAAVLDYTITMPGVVLGQGQALLVDGRWQVVYDPVSLHEDFPNIDLVACDDFRPGLADTVTIGLLLGGQNASGQVWQATVVTLQGQQVAIAGQGMREVPRSPTGRLP